MMKTHLSLSWHLYHSNMQSGFSTSQRNGDFVDLTIAADGHFVKVHQLILGVASPYIKNLIQSATCEHPVIFLNDVSYPILCSILEYVYTGEVAIADDNIETFLSVAKSLQIQGLNEMDVVNSDEINVIDEYIENNKNKIKDNLQNTNIQVINDKSLSYINEEKTASMIDILTNTETASNDTEQSNSWNVQQDILESEKQIRDSPNEIDSVDRLEGDAMDSSTTIDYPMKSELGQKTNTSIELQYTVSSRGFLQLILNRYIYNLFSRSGNGQIRRWRCVDYRDRKCRACVVTNENVVVKRSNMHIHPFHDRKIVSKVRNKNIYSAIKAVDNYREPEK